MEAFIFMIIFSVTLMFSAVRLYTDKNPRDSILLYKVQGKEKMNDEQIKDVAKRTAKGVGVVAAVIMIGGIVGLFNTVAGGLVMIFGTVAALVYVGQDFKKK